MTAIVLPRLLLSDIGNEQTTLFGAYNAAADRWLLSARPSDHPFAARVGAIPGDGPRLTLMESGRWHGLVPSSQGGLAAARALYLPGAGMLRLTQNDPVPYNINPRWSRTAGVLGGAHERLTRLACAVVGCGRNGWLIAEALHTLGVERLTLIDPDLVETHNLGEMSGLCARDVGRPKVEACLTLLGRPPSDGIADTARSEPARAAIAKSDLLITACDNDAARLYGSTLALRYCLPHIDAGTGASADGRMGADVRLIVPADGCLACRGGLSDFGGAIRGVLSGDAPARPRNGSLRSLNQLACGIAMRMLEDLAAERIHTSQWARLEYAAGRAEIRYPGIAPVSCEFCQRFFATGRNA